jgi:hypothetical protein
MTTTAMMIKAREETTTNVHQIAAAAPSAPEETRALIKAPEAAAAASTDVADCWLKATLDGSGIWSRHDRPVPRTIEVTFDPSSASLVRNLRLEGTASGVHVALPPALNAPHIVTIRNLTAGPAIVSAPGGRAPLEVPAGRCWLVLVDADGPVHVE